MRALEEMGIASVGVYSELDRDALHVARADEAYLLGPGPAAESYLKIEKILEVAVAGRRRGDPSRLRLPGRERRLRRAPARRPGSRSSARRPRRSRRWAPRRRRASSCRRPACPSCRARPSRCPTSKAARKVIDQDIGYPVAVKAAGGGGGKGFRVALSEDELEDAFEGASREGEKFFSDPTVYLERYLPDPRHVEVQVLADTHGNVVHLGERDCSVQRRHQKLIEESPAPAVDEELRERIGKIATDAATAVSYVGAGTIEGLLAGWGVLLPRDEHPRAGRALRDRDDHGHRHRPRGHPGGRGRAALREPGRRRAARVTRSSAASTPRTPRRTSPRPRAGSSPTASPPGPGVRVDSGVLDGSEISPDVRPDGREADRVGRRPRVGDASACCARCTSTRSTA